MSRLLLLTSNGLSYKIRNYFLRELNKNPKDLKIAFIPTAADLEKDKQFVKDSRDELIEIGFQVEDVDLKINKKKLRRKIEDCDLIYINGGNTFYLLEWIRKSGLDNYLSELIDSGKPYIGVSAGSIITGPNIESAGWDTNWDKNITKLKDLSGLNLVPFAIIPHFTDKDKDLLEIKSKKVTYLILSITDKQAILVKKDSYEIIPS